MVVLSFLVLSMPYLHLQNGQACHIFELTCPCNTYIYKIGMSVLSLNFLCLLLAFLHLQNGFVHVLQTSTKLIWVGIINFFLSIPYLHLQNRQAFHIIELICTCFTYIYKIDMGVLSLMFFFCLCLTYIYKIGRHFIFFN